MTPRRFLPWLLAAVTLGLYGQVVGFELVALDDYSYVGNNPHVRDGLTWDGLRWAFTTNWTGNWYPVTWLSYMLDSEILGTEPSGYHVTNVLLHALAAALLFGLLSTATGRVWTSAFAAALFAVHPLHVESVAWISERKDTLSMVFALLCMTAYVRSVQRRGHGRGWAVVVTFALGLMSKPTLVTLPLVLLMLDVWPLGRLKLGPGEASTSALGRLLLEKVPLLALSAALAVATFFAQRDVGAMSAAVNLSFADRAVNAAVSYLLYIVKALWPAGLAVQYPHPAMPGGTPWAPAQVAVALGALVGITIAAIRGRGRRPWALVGWVWYVVTLVPMIGLVQVGKQAMADRYAYFPLVGIHIMLAWGAAELAEQLRRRSRWVARLPAAAAVMALAALSVCTFHQTRVWRDSEALFTRAVSVSPRSPVANNSLGSVHMMKGRQEAAMASYRRALEVDPDYVTARINMGQLLMSQGRLPEAAEHLSRAVAVAPDEVDALSAFGNVSFALGRAPEALSHLRRALELAPDRARDHHSLGGVYAALGQWGDAARHYREAARIDPGLVESLERLGYVLALDGQIDAGAESLGRVLAAAPEVDLVGRARTLGGALGAEILLAIALAYEGAGRGAETEPVLRSALSLAESAGGTKLARAIRERLEERP